MNEHHSFTREKGSHETRKYHGKIYRFSEKSKINKTSKMVMHIGQGKQIHPTEINLKSCIVSWSNLDAIKFG